MTFVALCGYAHGMRAVVQRVSRARVIVENQTVGDIRNGLLVLLGLQPPTPNPMPITWRKKSRRCASLRTPTQDEPRCLQTGGAVLAVSQFTLYGDVRRGRRPSFDDAARPSERANSTSTLWMRSANTGCTARPASFRLRCRSNSSTRARSPFCSIRKNSFRQEFGPHLPAVPETKRLSSWKPLRPIARSATTASRYDSARRSKHEFQVRTFPAAAVRG